MIKLLLIIPWLLAALAAWWFAETNGSRIKKHDAKLYDELKDDKDGTKAKDKKAELETKKTEKKTKEEELEVLKKKSDDEKSDDDKTNIQRLEKEISEQADEIKVIESIDGKMWMPVMTIGNIGWMVGIFLVVGLIGHFLFKMLIRMFAGKDE